MFDPKKLKDARLKAGYTQEQIANILGIHPVSYNRWETGEREPKASYLLKLSSLLNVPIESSVLALPLIQRKGSE